MKGSLGKIWQLKPFDEELTNKISNELGINELLARILSSRVRDVEEAYRFISPKIKNLLPDPYHLLDMDKAVERVTLAMVNNEKICVYGDYDVDGATSSALLKNYFNELDIKIEVYIPDRIKEGYGLSIAGLDKLIAMDINLIITVDCGSVSIDEIAYAKAHNIDIIVIDHHKTLETLPDTIALINPNRVDENSEYTYLAAVGVTFLFLVGLNLKIKSLGNYNEKINNINLLKYLDLVALGTICDVMPIKGLNRAYVYQGLKMINYGNNIGIDKLKEVSGLEEATTCYHLGFILGPRINAGGRVGKSELGSKLLSCKNINEAGKIAAELNSYNEERKAIESIMLEEALDQSQYQINDNIIFVYNESWHPGIIGIIASRLKEKYNKPSIVISIDKENNLGKASCRSIKGIDLGNLIIEAKLCNLLINGGGHMMAAGFTVEYDKIQQLKIFFNDKIDKSFINDESRLIEFYDAEISAKALNTELLDNISPLAPYGLGNSEPLFRINKLFILKSEIIALKHIKVLFVPTKDNFSSQAINAIAFNGANNELSQILLNPKFLSFDVIGKIKLNKWNGNNNVQLIIEDVISRSA